MTEKGKLTGEDLARRVEALEDALDKMLGAFREELASLRADLRRMDAQAAHVRPTLPPPSRREASPPRRTVSEELVLHGTKKDPRADD